MENRAVLAWKGRCGTGKDRREGLKRAAGNFGRVMKFFIMLILVLVLRVSTYVKSHQIMRFLHSLLYVNYTSIKPVQNKTLVGTANSTNTQMRTQIEVGAVLFRNQQEICLTSNG